MPPVRTPPVVGLVGAGQLARMGQQAAIALGVELLVLDEAPDGPAVQAGARPVSGSARTLEGLRALAERADVVSFEHELVDLEALAALEAEGVAVRPSGAVLRLAVDKLAARRELGGRLGLPVPAFAPVQSAQDVAAFAAEHGRPVVLKARSGGYDGRGVWFCADEGDDAAALDDARAGGLELLAEAHVDLAGELAVLVARRPAGDLETFPVVGTRQEDGICREVVAPAGVGPEVEASARELAERLAEAVGLEGLMAVELFLARDGALLVNELALRPHNTGHLSIEACRTSQFEQHLRAVLDWPLGDPSLLVGAAAMVNVLGPADGSDPAARLPEALAVPAAKVHLYGKAARPGRKLGHVTATADDPGAALADARAAAAALEG